MRRRTFNQRNRLVMSTRRIQKFPAKIYNSLAAPVNNKAVSISHISNFHRLQILFCRRINKFFSVFCTHNNRHALLRLRNSKLSSVQTFILFRNFIQINIKTRGKFADCDRNTASAKVIAAANHQADILVPEQTLNFSLLDSISLLNFSGSRRNRFFSMNL